MIELYDKINDIDGLLYQIYNLKNNTIENLLFCCKAVGKFDDKHIRINKYNIY
jgi:hypothetical protein